MHSEEIKKLNAVIAEQKVEIDGLADELKKLADQKMELEIRLAAKDQEINDLATRLGETQTFADGKVSELNAAKADLAAALADLGKLRPM